MYFWQKCRAFLDSEYPEAVLVSEWSKPDQALLGGFHMDFCPEFFRKENSYFSSKCKGDISEFVKQYTEYYEKTKDSGMICIFSGNHDSKRLALTLDETEIKLAFAFLLSMPGAPFIYYGDEIGMRFVRNVVSVEGGYGRTGSRSPMQWNSDVNAGFGNSAPDKLYIPIDPDRNRPTVEKNMADENSIYHTVKKLIKLRNSHPALSNKGDVKFVYAEPFAYPFAYTRELDGEKILVVINTSADSAEFDCAINTGDIIWSFGGTAQNENGKIKIPARSAAFFKCN